MKKFLLIVNTTIVLIIFSFIILPKSIVAQNLTISPSASDLGQGNSNPLSLLQDLLKILFSFSSTGPVGPPPPTPGGYPPLSGSPLPPTSGYVYYPQCNGPYDNISLPNGCNLCKAGCGPTTVAMIVASLVDKIVTPQSIVDFYKSLDPFKGKAPYYLGCDGSRYTDAKATLGYYGLTTTDYLTYSSSTIDQVAQDFQGYLNSGWTIFALANYCDGGCGHFFWITQFDSNNQVWAYDPYYGRLEAPPINENRYYPFPRYRVAFGVRR